MFKSLLQLSMFLATCLPAVAQSDTDRAKVLGGIAGIVHAETVCGFKVDSDALASYLSKRGYLSPDSMAALDAGVLIAGATNKKMSDLQCSLQKAAAKDMGVLKSD